MRNLEPGLVTFFLTLAPYLSAFLANRPSQVPTKPSEGLVMLPWVSKWGDTALKARLEKAAWMGRALMVILGSH